MDETPELPESLEDAEGVQVEAAELPLPPFVTEKTLARDAVLDLASALGAGIGGIVVSGVLAGIGLIVLGRRTEEVAMTVTSPWGIAGLLLATQLPLLYFALRRRRRNREKQRPVGDLFGGPSWNAIPLGVAAGLAMTVLSAFYTSGLQRVLGPGSVENQVEFLKAIIGNKPAVTFLVFLIAGLAPMCEELFFRGVIFGSAHAAGFTKVGVVLSAILFATVHLSLVLAPFYFTFAVVMCWLYARTGTLAASIAAHATLNGVACTALLVAGNQV